MTIKVVYGNILDTDCEVLVQQVNCRGVMGGGLAKQIRAHYPIVYEKYREKCLDHDFKAEELLGKISYARVLNTKNNRYVRITSIFGQNNFGSDEKQYTDYEALKSGLVL